MTIFMKATIKVDAYKCEQFLDVLLTDIVPIMEEQGWKLHGCFVERFGPIKPAVIIDIWEMEDMAHAQRVMGSDVYRTDPRYQRALPLMKEAVLEESVTFMVKRGGCLVSAFE